MELEKLLDKLDYNLLSGSLNKDIKSIKDDSRKVEKGDLFIAIDGFTVDGHDYIEKAIEQGAVAIVISKEIDLKLDNEISLIKVEDDKEALARLSSNFYDRPSEKLGLVGITGTNGKTSITYMLKELLETRDKKVGLIGTMGSIIDGKKVDNLNTTPESIEIQRQIGEMVRADTDYCLMEVSSHSLDMKRVSYLDFEVGVFINLTEDHLDYHLNMDNYFNSKKKLFTRTRNINIINKDDSYGRILIDELSKDSSRKLITFGLDRTADLYADNIKCHNKGVDYRLCSKDGSIDIEMNLLGEFNVYNSLAAAAVALYYGYSLEDIKIGLESVRDIKGRFELVEIDEDFSVIIDFAHTPDGLEQVLKTIDGFSEGRTIVVFGAGGDRDSLKRPIMGEVVGRHADIPIVTSDNPRYEDPNSIIEDVLKGVKKVNQNYIAITDRRKAIEQAILIAKENDTILLAGKGHETYIQINGKTIDFDEKEIVLDIISDLRRGK